MTIAQLMDLKFYLNKLVKVDAIENYTLSTLLSLKSTYDKFLEESDGFDPDFPNTSHNVGKKGKKVKGVNKWAGTEESDLL